MSGKSKSVWTQEKIDLLTKMWCKENFTATKIAEELGFTKNAVIGKVNRLGLKKATTKKQKSPPKQETKYGKYKLAELKQNQCAWPEGGDEDDQEITFCGKEVLNKAVYCEEHNQMSFIKSNKKTLQEEIFLTKEDLDSEE